MLKETIIYTILTTIVLMMAYIFDVLLETSLFIIYYYFVKWLFNKQFHADTIAKSPRLAVSLCFTITFLTQLVFVALLISFNLSFFTNLYLGVLLGIFSYGLEDYLERIIRDKSIFNDKDKLLLACKEAKLTKEATNRLIMKYIDGLKIREIAELESVEELTISQSIRRSRRKLNI